MSEYQTMQRPVRVADVLVVLVKAIVITAAILYFGRFVGLNVREAGGQAMRDTFVYERKT